MGVAGSTGSASEEQKNFVNSSFQGLPRWQQSAIQLTSSNRAFASYSASETGSATVLMYAYVRMCRSWTLSCTRILFFWHGCTGSKGQNFVPFGGYTFDYSKWYTAIHIRKFQAVFFTTRSISAHITLNTSF